MALNTDGFRERALSAAKFTIGRTGTRVAEECIQLHGGIGVTDEYIVSHYFKKLTLRDVRKRETLIFWAIDNHMRSALAPVKKIIMRRALTPDYARRMFAIPDARLGESHRPGRGPTAIRRESPG